MKKVISVLSIALALLMICSVCGFAAGALSVASVKVGDSDKALAGASIDKSDVIVITFSGSMIENQDANAAWIAVYDGSGAKVSYTVHPVDPSQPNVVKVQLHDLAGGNYKLVIGSGVKADDGSALAAAKTVSFSVQGEAAPKTCQHICHSDNRLAQAIWNFMNKIFKFLKINQYCECGEAHW